MTSSPYRLVPVQAGDNRFYPDYLHLALEATQLGYWQVDLRSWQLTTSPQCKAKYGWDPDQDFTLEMFLECVHPEDREKVRKAFATVSRSDPNVSVEYRCYWADQQLHWNLSVGIALADRQGQPQHIVGVTLDISERKQLEAALAEQERHHRQILETIPDMLFRLDRQGKCLEFKPPSHFPTLHPPDFYLGKTPQELFPDPYAEAILQHLELAFGTQQVQEMEYLWAGPSPHPQYRQARFVPFGEDEMLVIVRDITSRKQTELRLQQRIEREKLLNQLVQAINTALDLPTLFEVAVCSVRQVLGAARVTLYQYLPAEAVWVGIASDGDFETLPSTLNLRVPDNSEFVVIDHLKQLQIFCVQDPEQVADSSPTFQIALQEKQKYQLGPWLVVPVAHQGHLWGGLSLQRLTTDPDWESEDIELATAISDHLVVAIQQAELYQRLQQTNAELDYQVRVRNAEIQQAYNYEALLQLITEEIRASLDEQQILETVAQELAISLNLSNCAIALYDSERQVSVLAVDYLAGEGIRRFPLEIPFVDFADVLKQLQQGQVCHFSHFHHPCWPDHDRYTLLIAPIYDDGDPTRPDRDPRVLGDICGSRPPGQVFTEQEQRLIYRVACQCAIAIRQARFYQTIQQQVQQLQTLNQLKDEFLHMVSHEMRTPLTNMKLAIGFLSKANLTEREKHYLQILEMETNREIDLINDLLELQAIESGNKALKLSCLSPQEWIEEISAPFLLRAIEQRQHFQVQLDPGLLPLYTDENLLSRVVSELLNNACKYTPAEQEIHLRVSQAIQNGTLGWLITVRNTGVEIPAEALPHLFEKFYRVTHLDRRNVGGTGLGLPLAQKAVELLQGSLTVESHSDQVIFQVWCPHQDSLREIQSLPHQG
ncbi:GAF domain-containing protein [Thermostichus vulcanus]|uniref:histidine kinase n=1 Tax=Thermostichus vulcanus str. 'Rupite' TaxID=2813851 RepID=A0ABT0C6H1_THEVL|nr:GAF domain-containing protein [Thermostichus vulcanus]MCJ2541302.1 GAF domain-containing protein [Thermostichus vulcanus str. 'Rupite']